MEKKLYIKPVLETCEVSLMKMVAISFPAYDADADPEEEMLTKDWCNWQGTEFDQFLPDNE